MQKILSLIDRLLHFLLITTVLLLIIPVSLQIFSRFTELIPRYMWTEEMSRFFFVWLIMLGATLGVRERLHFDVDFLPELSPRATHVLLRLSQTAMLGFSAVTSFSTGALSSQSLAGIKLPNWQRCPCGGSSLHGPLPVFCGLYLCWITSLIRVISAKVLTRGL